MGFVKDLQSQLANLMLVIVKDIDKADQMTAHTEYLVKNAEGETEKFLISSTIRPLTEELKKEISGNAQDKKLQKELPPSEKPNTSEDTKEN